MKVCTNFCHHLKSKLNDSELTAPKVELAMTGKCLRK